MQTDAEHQQDHADLRELVREGGVGDEAGRERADADAGDQITEQRRQPEPLRDHAEREREYEAGDDRGDQRRVMRHGLSLIGPADARVRRVGDAPRHDGDGDPRRSSEYADDR